MNLTNSDSRVLKLWVRFLENVCHVLPNKLRGRIDYYEDLDYPTLLIYWSQELGIPTENFDNPTLKHGRIAKGDYNRRRSEYGTVHVKFYDTRLAALMKSWMDDLLEGRL